MIRRLNVVVWCVGVVAMIVATPAMARHEDDELGRARRELAEAERGYHVALAEVSRARASLDGTVALRAQVAALLDAAIRNAQGARVGVDVARQTLDRLHAEHARLERETIAITQALDGQRARLDGARRHVDVVRGRLVAEFEQGRSLLDAAGAAEAARERTALVEAAVLRYVQDSPRYWHLDAEVKYHRTQVERLERGWYLDQWRLAAAKRVLAEAKQRREEFVSRTIEIDPQVMAAHAEVVRAQAAFDHVRERFARDLERHPQVWAAQEAVGREESLLRRMESDLAAARHRCAALGVQIRDQEQALGAATHQLQCSEGEVVARQREVDQASGAVYAAQGQVARAGECEQQARDHRDRAARRVAYLENDARIHGGRGRGGPWRDRDDDRPGLGRRFRED